MAGQVDPYAVLGVRPGADQAEIHKAYRAAVRRTHPDAGGTAAAFEAVQAAYETLRDGRPPPRRSTREQTPGPGRGQTAGPGQDAGDADAPTGGQASGERSRMEELLAESRRLENEARRLAGLPPRDGDGSPPPGPASADSVSAILRDAGEQLRAAADVGARELRRRVRRLL
ncbi:MAG TPA: J domain-containing protein [Solirubrobacteraceae bacterium]|nr:J domain-containing protein [Solirubrobacteraceae bacterium]